MVRTEVTANEHVRMCIITQLPNGLGTVEAELQDTQNSFVFQTGSHYVALADTELTGICCLALVLFTGSHNIEQTIINPLMLLTSASRY